MFASRAGIMPVIRCCALTAFLSGCASTPNSQSYGYYDTGVATQAKVAQARDVVEDDGLPSQSPPRAHIRSVPDEPDEPFSANYGGSNPAASPTTPAVRTKDDVPVVAPAVARARATDAALPWAVRTVSYTYADE